MVSLFTETAIGSAIKQFRDLTFDPPTTELPDFLLPHLDGLRDLPVDTFDGKHGQVVKQHVPRVEYN
jgi:hypothetical protein